jgi:hypothetical protein
MDLKVIAEGKFAIWWKDKIKPFLTPLGKPTTSFEQQLVDTHKALSRKAYIAGFYDGIKSGREENIKALS